GGRGDATEGGERQCVDVDCLVGDSRTPGSRNAATGKPGSAGIDFARGREEGWFGGGGGRREEPGGNQHQRGKSACENRNFWIGQRPWLAFDAGVERAAARFSDGRH